MKKTVEVSRPFGKVTAKSLYTLLQWQEFCCALTGRPLTTETAEADHIIPISKGGAHDIANIQFLHKEVNRAKNTLMPDEFLSLCREVVDRAGEGSKEQARV